MVKLIKIIILEDVGKWRCGETHWANESVANELMSKKKAKKFKKKRKTKIENGSI